MSTHFGADSSSRFPFRLRINRQTERCDWTPYPTPAATCIQPAWVMMTTLWSRLKYFSVDLHLPLKCSTKLEGRSVERIPPPTLTIAIDFRKFNSLVPYGQGYDWRSLVTVGLELAQEVVHKHTYLYIYLHTDAGEYITSNHLRRGGKYCEWWCVVFCDKSMEQCKCRYILTLFRTILTTTSITH